MYCTCDGASSPTSTRLTARTGELACWMLISFGCRLSVISGLGLVRMLVGFGFWYRIISLLCSIYGIGYV